MEISQKEVDVLRHALGWPKCYRNYFVTGEGSDDFTLCEKLVKKGLMFIHRVDWIPDNIYIVTQKGKDLLANYPLDILSEAHD